jgi:transposase
MKRYYCGLDLHSNNTFIGVLDEDDRRVFCKRSPNDILGILEYLKPFKEAMSGVVVESTFNWYWLVDGLMDVGYKVHLAHPPAIVQYKGLKVQDDKHSSFFLAKLLKLGILPEGYIFPKEDRYIRDLLRKRLMLVQNSTKYILNFKSMMNRSFSVSINSNEIKKLNPDLLKKEFFKNNHLLLSAKSSISAINYFHNEIKILEREILKEAKLKPEFQRLLSVPGIGKILGLTIALETGNINRFSAVGNYASYCRNVSSVRSSNKKRKGSANKKNGNKYLAWAYLEAAHKLKRYCPQAKTFHERKKIKTNIVVAIKALAHKLSRACYYMMKDGTEFDVEKIFGKPIKVESGSKSTGGLANKPNAPIDNTAA